MIKIAFFGTSKFSAKILKKIHQICKKYNYNLSCIISQPDKPQKRGKKKFNSETKILAKQSNLNILQPIALKNKDFLSIFNSKNIDLAIVIDYGQIIPNDLLNNVKFGFLNIHPSLLPRWRGAAPIHRAIEAGDIKTGISYMHLTSKIDAGDIYDMYRINIDDDVTTEELTNKLAELTINTIEKTILSILNKTSIKKSQNKIGITYANKITKKEGRIDWGKNDIQIVNHVRAMCNWPSSYTNYNGKLLKLFCAKKSLFINKNNAPNGTILNIKKLLIIACNNGSVSFEKFQFENKRILNIDEFSNNNCFLIGNSFH